MRALMLALALYALFLPFYGPVSGHHFAERQPGHEHLYLGRFAPDHVHPYQVPHAHSHPNEAGNSGLQDLPKGDPNPDGIVFLPSHDGMSQVFTWLTMPSLHLSLDLPGSEDTHLAFGIPTDDTNLQDAYLALPKKPPRA